MLKIKSKKNKKNIPIIKEILEIKQTFEFLQEFLKIHPQLFENNELQIIKLRNTLSTSIESIALHATVIIHPIQGKKNKLKIKSKEGLTAIIKTCRNNIDAILNALLLLHFEPKECESTLKDINAIFFSDTIIPISTKNSCVTKIFIDQYDQNLTILANIIKEKSIQLIELIETDFLQETTTEEDILSIVIKNLFKRCEEIPSNEMLAISLQSYKDALNDINTRNYSRLQRLAELQQSIMLSFSDKPNPDHLPKIKSPNQKVVQDKSNSKKIEDYAKLWLKIFKTESAEALIILKYLCQTSIKNDLKQSTLIIVIKNIDDFAVLLTKMTGLTAEQQEIIITVLIETMGNSIFDLIAAHYKQETKSAGRDDSITAGIVKRLVKVNDDFKKYILSSIQPILDLTVENNALAELNNSVSQAIKFLFIINLYPSEIKRIIHGFSIEHQDKLLGYILTRFINPIILHYGEHADDQNVKFWCANIIIFVLQALNTIQAKQDSYHDKISLSLFEFFKKQCNGVSTQEQQMQLTCSIAAKTLLDHVISMQDDIKQVCVDAAKTIDPIQLAIPNIILSNEAGFIGQASIHRAKQLDYQVQLLFIGQQLIQLAWDTKLTGIINIPVAEECEQYINSLTENMNMLKKVMDLHQAVNDKKLLNYEQIDAYETELLIFCYCLSQELEINSSILDIIDKKFQVQIWSALAKLGQVHKEEANSYVGKIIQAHYLGWKRESALKMMIETKCKEILDTYEDSHSLQAIEIDPSYFERWQALYNSFQNLNNEYKQIANGDNAQAENIAAVGFLAAPTVPAAPVLQQVQQSAGDNMRQSFSLAGVNK